MWGMRSLMPLSSMHAQAGQAVSYWTSQTIISRPLHSMHARASPNGTTGALPAPRNHIREHQREAQVITLTIADATDHRI